MVLYLSEAGLLCLGIGVTAAHPQLLSANQGRQLMGNLRHRPSTTMAAQLVLDHTEARSRELDCPRFGAGVVSAPNSTGRDTAGRGCSYEDILGFKTFQSCLFCS